MTPQTIARIRVMAVTCIASRIANELAWDAARVVRVARNHGIEVRDSFTAAASVVPSHEILNPRFDASVSLPEIFDKLPNIQCRVLRMLDAARGFVSASKLADTTGVSRETVARCVPQIACTLHGTRWRIESKAARDGGYRLVEVMS